MILDQRTEIETFLIEAINYVKQQSKKESMYETRKSKFPDIPKRPETTQTGKRNSSVKLSEKTEIGELDWEEKEKILRILFSKINTNTNAKKWKENSFNRELFGVGINNTEK